MRVFVTGASGWVGTSVTQDLIKAGHQVLGLARSEASAKAVKDMGAEVIRGDLTDLDSLRKGAMEAEAVIHTAFVHDFSKFKENCEIDARAIRAMGEKLEGKKRTLIVTSGTALVAPGRLALETDRNDDHKLVPRVSEQTAFEFGKRGVKTMAIRLSPSVHGAGDHGFVPILVNLAKTNGFAAYVGDGQNSWSGVHRFDTGPLYRLALEKGQADRAYHGVAESSVPFKQIAEAISKGLNLPVKSLSGEEAQKYFQWFVGFASIDAPASNELTRKELGWTPTQTGLIDDILKAGYCK